MGKPLHSDALGVVNRLLGLAGTQVGASQTELDDGNLSQVLGVNELVRRSRTPAGTDGIFIGVFQNTMGAGETDETSFVDPYNIGAAVRKQPWVSDPRTTIEQGIDVWVLGCAVKIVSGAANVDSAAFTRTFMREHWAWGVDEAGAGVLSNDVEFIAIANFTQVDTDTAIDFMKDPSGRTYIPVNMRIRRGELLSFQTNANNAAVISGVMLLGQFPSAVGQDVVAG